MPILFNIVLIKPKIQYKILAKYFMHVNKFKCFTKYLEKIVYLGKNF